MAFYRTIFLGSFLILTMGLCVSFASGREGNPAASTAGQAVNPGLNTTASGQQNTLSQTTGTTTGNPSVTNPQSSLQTTLPNQTQSTSQTSEPTPTTGPTPTVEVMPVPQATDGSVEVVSAERDQRLPDNLPASLILLAVVLTCLVTVATVAAVAHWRAWQPRWWTKAGHACAEASWRVSLGWNEFLDWLRIGR